MHSQVIMIQLTWSACKTRKKILNVSLRWRLNQVEGKHWETLLFCNPDEKLLLDLTLHSPSRLSMDKSDSLLLLELLLSNTEYWHKDKARWGKVVSRHSKWCPHSIRKLSLWIVGTLFTFNTFCPLGFPYLSAHILHVVFSLVKQSVRGVCFHSAVQSCLTEENARLIQIKSLFHHS